MFVPRVQETQIPVSLPQELPPVSGVVKAVAIQILKDLALILAFGCPVAFFVATPAGLTVMLSASIVQISVSIFFHALGAFASYQALKREGCQAIYEKMVSICEWLTGANFGLFTGFNAQILIHESGHALMSMLVYKNPRPLIEIYPFLGGVTQFYKTGLSSLGKQLGPAAATCLVLSCGPGLILLASSALLAIGIAMKEKHPQFGKYLISWSAISFLDQIIYAYSALSAESWNLTHDFVHLSIFGLHPVAATVGLVAIPLVISLGMYWWQARTEEPPREPLAAIV